MKEYNYLKSLVYDNNINTTLSNYQHQIIIKTVKQRPKLPATHSKPKKSLSKNKDTSKHESSKRSILKEENKLEKTIKSDKNILEN